MIVLPTNTSASFTSTFVDIAITAKENVNLGVLALLIFAICGVMGNSLVCLAICTERALQTVTNYFLCSLAVADLLVSSVVMPLAIINELNKGMWRYGVTLCIAFTSLDVFLCSASIVHMAVISLDRYRGISRPFHARKKSKTKMVLKILAVWAITFMATVPMTTLAFIDPGNVYNGENCQINNRHFQIYGTIGTFFIPCTMMIIAYGLTVMLLRRQAHLCNNGNIPTSSSNATSRTGSSSSPLMDAKIRRSVCRRRRFDSRVSLTSAEKIVIGKDAQISNGTPTKLTRHLRSANANCITPLLKQTSLLSQRSHRQSQDIGSIQIISQTNPDCSSSSAKANQGGSASPPNTTKTRKCSQQLLPMKKAAATLLQFAKRSNAEQTLATEQKATNVLGVVFFSFVLCWAPFFIANITLAICQQQCLQNFPHYLGTAFLWLGYASSSLNPLIYTTFNKLFRQSFIRILRCQICYPRYNQRGARGSRDIYSTSMRSNVSYCARTNPAQLSVYYSNIHINNTNSIDNNYNSYSKTTADSILEVNTIANFVESSINARSPGDSESALESGEVYRPRLSSLGSYECPTVQETFVEKNIIPGHRNNRWKLPRSATFGAPGNALQRRTSASGNVAVLYCSYDNCTARTRSDIHSVVSYRMCNNTGTSTKSNSRSGRNRRIKRSRSFFDKPAKKSLTRSAYSELHYPHSKDGSNSSLSDIFHTPTGQLYDPACQSETKRAAGESSDSMTLLLSSDGLPESLSPDITSTRLIVPNNNNDCQDPSKSMVGGSRINVSSRNHFRGSGQQNHIRSSKKLIVFAKDAQSGSKIRTTQVESEFLQTQTFHDRFKSTEFPMNPTSSSTTTLSRQSPSDIFIIPLTDININPLLIENGSLTDQKSIYFQVKNSQLLSNNEYCSLDEDGPIQPTGSQTDAPCNNISNSSSNSCNDNADSFDRVQLDRKPICISAFLDVI